MKLSLEWLSAFVTFTEKDPQAISRAITAHVAEVDEVEEQGAVLKDCCVAKVLTLVKHPNADKLNLLTVQTDKGTKQVVCGGTNLRLGMNVAFAHVGATVLDHEGGLFTLSKAKIRGEDSEGMICAAMELDLVDRYPSTPEEGTRPIVDLGENEKDVGQDLRTYMGLTDTVLHIDNHAITHRADLFSHIGFARECAAIGIATWKKGFSAAELPMSKIAFGKESVPFKMNIQSPELMPRYCACLIEIDGLGQTPDWMKRRLEAVGWRSINLPIDITNYVASEMGVPLHSFDADDVRGDVAMRKAKKGEKIITLDQKERELSPGALILSDDDGVFDLLGIMGGLRSSTKESTRKIYLHSASLDPVSIRSAVIAMGHRTDAATVYEKGVPHIVTEAGFLRAVELLLELAPGAKVVSRKEEIGTNGAAKTIELSMERVNSVLGADISAKQAEKILQDLGCDVSRKVEKSKSHSPATSKPANSPEGAPSGLTEELLVTPPLWRLKDLAGAHDLIEEVGRVYGFDTIPTVLPSASIVPPKRDQRAHRLRDALQECGYWELLPLNLLSPELLERCNMDPAKAVRIGNPIGEDMSLMQPCVLPRLLEHAERAITQTDATLRTFHAGHIFSAPGAPEILALGMLYAARHETTLLDDPFLSIKRDICESLEALGYEPETVPAEKIHASGHPGRSAKLMVGGTQVGQVFEVHPAVRERFDLPHRAAALLLDLDALLAMVPGAKIATATSQFPSVVYDITVTIDHNRAVASLLQQARAASPLLEAVEVADLYDGKPLTGGQYNLTLRCTYRSVERTLTEEEVKKEHQRVEEVMGG